MLRARTHQLLRDALAVVVLAVSGLPILPGCSQSVDTNEIAQTSRPAAILRIESPVPIYVSKAEPKPLQRAVEDLQRDLQKVLGLTFPIIQDKEQMRRGTAIVVIGPAADVSLGKDRWAKGREAHRVFVAQSGNVPHVVLQGADIRGAIYAVYSFSEHFLGIPPLWLWASHEVERRDHIDVPLSTELFFNSPSVKWRAFFPNDQDYLKEWKSNPSNRDAIAETALRLKLNAWDTGEVINETMTDLEDDARAARNRGIVVMSSHPSPLGTGMDEERWNNYWKNIRGTTPPEMSCTDVDALTDFWKQSIDVISSKHAETIWTVTFRAPGDHGFWDAFKDAPESDAERSALVQRMLERQVELVDKFGGRRPMMRIPLYNELSDYFLAGLLHLPARKDVVWNLVSARRDHFPPDGVFEMAFPDDQPLGLYFNMNFVSSGSHVVAGEGPWKMEANVRAINSLNKAPLAFSIVNCGNFREFVMELSANARMMWDFDGYSSDSFLEEFSTEYFGKEHAPQVAALYREYYDSYWQQRKPTIPGFDRQFIFHDLRYARAMRAILPLLKAGRATNEPIAPDEADRFRIVPEHTGATSTLDAIILGTAQSIAKLKIVTVDADALLQKLPRSRRVFFNDNLRVPCHFMLQLNQSLHQLALALREIDQPDKKQEHLTASLSAFRRARLMLLETEHGPFQTWYPQPGQRDSFHFDFIESRLSQLLESRE